VRDTEYAKELATGSIGYAKIERLYVKEQQEKEIRFPCTPMLLFMVCESGFQPPIEYEFQRLLGIAQCYSPFFSHLYLYRPRLSFVN
jgi:hypothetical protein